MLGPVFVKGHLAFTVENHNLEFIHQNISVFGVTGLPWDPLSPREHFGRAVSVNVRIPGAENLNFRTRAYIMREQTLYAEHMGLRFLLDAEQKTVLQKHIDQKGFYPTEYIRKYPRIPSNPSIQTFPLRALCFPKTLDTDEPQAPIIFDVLNLSPNGVLVHTESQLALAVVPGQRLDMILEPRGWFPQQVEVEGLVCRTADEMNTTSGNLTRYIGIKFNRVDEANKTIFLDLLRDILERMKK